MRVKKYSNTLLFSLLCACAIGAAVAQDLKNVQGTLISVSGFGEVRHTNNQATLILTVEEQDKDKALSASRVNLKMKEGMNLIRKLDPAAILKTQNYTTYAVYAQNTRAQARGAVSESPQIVGWRVAQSLEVMTTNLDALPTTVAAVQDVLGLSDIQFSLQDETRSKLDAKRIETAYAHLQSRISTIAAAMGRKAEDAIIEALDFKDAGFQAQESMMLQASAPRMFMKSQTTVEEPDFEPGEATLSIQVSAKVRFLP